MSKQLSRDDKERCIDQIIDLQGEICQAVTQLARIAKALDAQHAIHYIIAPLQIASDAEHGWSTRDSNLTEWVKELQAELDESEAEGGDDDDA